MPSFKNSVGLFVGKGLAPAENILINYNLKNGLNIEFKPFLALFVFCSGAVPSYSSHSQNTKFISLSQHSPACRNLFFDFFYTLKEIAVTQSLFGLYRYFRRTQFAPTKYQSNIIYLPTIYPGFHQYIAILFGNHNHHE